MYGKNAIDESIAPQTGKPAIANIQNDCRADQVQAVQCKIGKALANFILPEKNSQIAIAIDIIAGRMEQDFWAGGTRVNDFKT
jgi:hypothetical protein